MFNALPLNPAYAGTAEELNITVIARKQWLNIDGAPATQTLSVMSPVKKEKMALGFTAINDYIGVTHQTGFYGIYAFKIKLSAHSKLSLGLQAGFTNYVSRFSELEVRTPNDPAFASNDVRYLLPNFGAGAFYYSKKFYAGISAPYILDHLDNNSNVALNAMQSRTYLFTSGYVATLSPELKIKPSILFRVANGVPVQADINTTFIIHDVLWFGVSYRSFSSLNFIAQLQLSNRLSFGYSYDIPLNKISSASSGSHEVMLSYRFINYNKNMIIPRYF